MVEDNASNVVAFHIDVINDLQCEVFAFQSNMDPSEDSQFSSYCRNSPCVILSENLPSSLKAQGHTTNHTKRKWDYKAYSQEEACGMTLFI